MGGKTRLYVNMDKRQAYMLGYIAEKQEISGEKFLLDILPVHYARIRKIHEGAQSLANKDIADMAITDEERAALAEDDGCTVPVVGEEDDGTSVSDNTNKETHSDDGTDTAGNTECTQSGSDVDSAALADKEDA